MIIQDIQCKISAASKAQLDAVFSEDDVRNALFDMHPTKAPGPDGFHALFFQKHWSIVGTEVSQAVLAILNDGALWLVLILHMWSSFRRRKILCLWLITGLLVSVM